MLQSVSLQDKHLDQEEKVQLCMPVSVGAVTTIGTKPPSKEVVDKLIEQVTVKMLPKMGVPASQEVYVEVE